VLPFAPELDPAGEDPMGFGVGTAVWLRCRKGSWVVKIREALVFNYAYLLILIMQMCVEVCAGRLERESL